MKINQYQDLIYEIRIYNAYGEVIRLKDTFEFNAKFYTTTPTIYAECTYNTNENINITIQENRDLCNINEKDLEKFQNGLIKFRYTYKVLDKNFQDGYFDASFNGETNYFLSIKNNGNEIDLSNYYTKKETYNQLEINDLLSNKQNTLIAGENISIENNVISANAGDLSNYYNKQESYNQLETNDLLSNKVDKELNKQLSTNDYSNNDKIKLSNLNNYDDTEIKTDISNLNNRVNNLETEMLNVDESLITLNNITE